MDNTDIASKIENEADEIKDLVGEIRDELENDQIDKGYIEKRLDDIEACAGQIDGLQDDIEDAEEPEDYEPDIEDFKSLEEVCSFMGTGDVFYHAENAYDRELLDAFSLLMAERRPLELLEKLKTL